MVRCFWCGGGGGGGKCVVHSDVVMVLCSMRCALVGSLMLVRIVRMCRDWLCDVMPVTFNVWHFVVV